MMDNNDRRRTASPILPSGEPISDIRSGTAQVPASGPSREHARGTNNNETLSALVSLVESLTKQQQMSLKDNNEMLTNLFAQAASSPHRPRLSDIYIAPFDPWRYWGA